MPSFGHNNANKIFTFKFLKSVFNIVNIEYLLFSKNTCNISCVEISLYAKAIQPLIERQSHSELPALDQGSKILFQ